MDLKRWGKMAACEFQAGNTLDLHHRYAPKPG